MLVNPDLTVNTAGGYLIQVLPFASDDVIDTIEKNIKDMTSVTTLMGSGMTAEDIALKVLDGLKPNVLDDFEVNYRCDCSRERVKKALVACGKDELMSMSKEKETRVECHFCDKVYSFSSEEILELLKENR